MNYYAKSSKQDINNLTLIYNNPKSNISNTNDLNFKHYLLTPNMKEDKVLSFKARHEPIIV
ncbi:hypothetical protein CS797_07360 [Campylobacter jejuni]|uniref:Uncharacterized protein n=1 Tax=Campylobacter jejuni TaxID=197 RepID=A0A5T0Q5F6_CAMJU|nr:hypothetical protein [Campylobacter jejuni]PCH16902.1 hypothetical protein BGS47_05200 [Campylobacter sp. 114]TEX83484.1 hypothetical protein ELQ09_08165 [Campylobacter sp. CH186]TEX94881.1 hypothetical protein ELQ05_08130 [Campylobacter sp. US53]TEY27738.1 hypothetical protein ELQ27_09520 [Campylobacter sp. CH185]